MEQERQHNLLRIFIFIFILLLTIGIIVFLKRSDTTPLAPAEPTQQDSVSNIVHPDTVSTPEIDNKTNIETIDTIVPEENDSISTDLRSPTDAGFEDGYYAGLQDGISGDDHASYDESSQFPEADQRQSYTEAYRRGYKSGYEDGINGGEKKLSPLLNNNTNPGNKENDR